MGLADGRGGPALPKVTLPAIRDQPVQHAGLDLLKVVCLRTDFSLQEADVRLIASLLLKDRTGGRQVEQSDVCNSYSLRLQLVLFSFFYFFLFVQISETDSNRQNF